MAARRSSKRRRPSSKCGRRSGPTRRTGDEGPSPATSFMAASCESASLLVTSQRFVDDAQWRSVDSGVVNQDHARPARRMCGSSATTEVATHAQASTAPAVLKYAAFMGIEQSNDEGQVAVGLVRAEVAARLGRSIAAVRRLEGDRSLPIADSRGVWRFDRDRVDALAAMMAPRSGRTSARASEEARASARKGRLAARCPDVPARPDAAANRGRNQAAAEVVPRSLS